MTVHAAGALAPTPAFAVSNRLEAFCATADFDRPTLVIDVDRVEEQYRALQCGLGGAVVHYAVKANPHPAILARLVALGAHFDAASRGEIEMCLAAGATPDRISFGNTIKRAPDIAWAQAAGITLFAADAEEELRKIAAQAPAAQVYIRVIVEASMADWPLTRKFGCDRGEALASSASPRTSG
jgi:ornithine decarboxylase